MTFDAAYRSGLPPWEIGRPQPAFERLARTGVIGGSVLDVGCGTGENALLFSSLGHDAWGIDLSPTAIERARLKASARSLPVVFMQGDALRLDGLGRTFDTVIDSGCFHVFDDEGREAYARSVGAVLQPGGRLHLLCFSDLQPGTFGPRRLSQAELRSTFASGWRVDAIQPDRFDILIDPDGALAWLATFTRL